MFTMPLLSIMNRLSAVVLVLTEQGMAFEFLFCSLGEATHPKALF